MHGGESGGHGGDSGSIGAAAAAGSDGGRDQSYREDLRGWVPVFGITAAVIAIGLLVVFLIK
ncbi:hypothetical protein ACQPXS_33855 [Streptomyces sp. CA-142005]|jgi:hypothetical protein|uniref:hypothetical protein n=1 Tax=Streptomyces sp. CA-142005 TaxID=3240052 RepID=UPI003D94E4C2